MSARRIDGLLNAYLDGELADADRRGVEAELTRSPGAAARLEELKATVRLISGLPRLSAPEDTADTVLRRIERDALLKAAPRRLPLRWLRGFGVAAAAAAAVLVMAIVIGTLEPPRSHAPQVAATDELTVEVADRTGKKDELDERLEFSALQDKGTRTHDRKSGTAGDAEGNEPTGVAQNGQSFLGGRGGRRLGSSAGGEGEERLRRMKLSLDKAGKARESQITGVQRGLNAVRKVLSDRSLQHGTVDLPQVSGLFSVAGAGDRTQVAVVSVRGEPAELASAVEAIRKNRTGNVQFRFVPMSPRPKAQFEGLVKDSDVHVDLCKKLQAGPAGGDGGGMAGQSQPARPCPDAAEKESPARRRAGEGSPPPPMAAAAEVQAASPSTRGRTWAERPACPGAATWDDQEEAKREDRLGRGTTTAPRKPVAATRPEQSWLLIIIRTDPPATRHE